MKKFVSLLLCLLLTVAVFGFAACGEKEPELTDEQLSELNVKIDYSGLINFSEAVANIKNKTALNNYSSCIGYLDELLLEGRAMAQTIEKENVKDAEGLDRFKESYELIADLRETAEKAAAKYVKGFYKAVGKKDVTAVYCYMNVNPDAENGNSYIFALTYNEGETPVTVYMDATVTSDAVEVSVYEKSPEKFYNTECNNKMMNTPVYNNITLDLETVLSAAK
ncbi:MAG: hypothetical protein IJA31_02975 [Clostridia bacterium]|nr:hypothetical protein [Clostridia bacterium]MBR2413556.1 hypothetical protein [Clostridia bacterium]